MARQQDDLLALLNDSGEATVDQAIARAREEVDRLDNVVLNIAITGVTGAGKSTIVNALRGVEDSEPGAAKTGVTETTMKAEAYSHPYMSKVTIWDLPGIGSERFKPNTYLKDVNFQDYDFFIIVNQKRFKVEDVMLTKEIKKQNKNFYFVRTMIDEDVRAAQRRRQTERQTLQEIREYCQTELRELGPPPIFLISSFDLEKYDFQDLQDALERDLPKHKRDALVLSLPVYSLQSLEKKYKTFKEAVWALAVLSGGIGGVPLPGLSPACDVVIVLSFFTKCYFSFGLDDKSLTKIGERVNKPILEIVKESELVRAIADKTFISTKMAARLGAAGVIEALCSLVPVAGNIAATGVSFVTTRSVLSEGLEELYKAAQKVIELSELQ